jgi:hypothetical protein
MIRGVFVLLLVASFPVVACDSAADCDAGSVCKREPGQMSGVCVSALGNRTDTTSPFDKVRGPNTKACTSDAECAFGSSCSRQSGQVYGVCRSTMGGGVPNVGPH